MATSERVKIVGVREVQASFARYERGVRKTVSKAGYMAAKIVSTDARPRFSGIDSKTATGFVPSIRGPVAKVKQRIGPTTGLRGDFGSLQMRRALLPALYAKQGEAVRVYETSLEVLQKEAGL